jgi:hypothetical protein
MIQSVFIFAPFASEGRFMPPIFESECGLYWPAWKPTILSGWLRRLANSSGALGEVDATVKNEEQ